MKKCSKCKKTKSSNKFYRNRTKKDGLACWCIKCRKAWDQTKKGKAARRKIDLNRRFNLTPTRYNKLFKSQNGRCAICKIHQSKLKRRLAADHDHQTGKIRGLLCFRCNVFLGHLEKNPKFISQALKYLKS